MKTPTIEQQIANAIATEIDTTERYASRTAYVETEHKGVTTELEINFTYETQWSTWGDGITEEQGGELLGVQVSIDGICGTSYDTATDEETNLTISDFDYAEIEKEASKLAA